MKKPADLLKENRRLKERLAELEELLAAIKSGSVDAFVTDANLSRVRISIPVAPFPAPKEWTHLAIAWDETRGIRFYVNGKLAAENNTISVLNIALDQFGPHSRIISPYQVQSDYNFIRGGDVDEQELDDRQGDGRHGADGAVHGDHRDDQPLDGDGISDGCDPASGPG